MNEFLNFTIIGIVTGAAYAIAASGLVVTYATSGVFNIAHGAIGMAMAYVYWQLVEGWHWNIVLAALLVVVVLAPAFGAFVDIAIMRRVRGEALYVTLVITIALLVLLFFVADWIWGGNLRAAPAFFGHSGWHLDSKVFVSWHETITILMAGGLALLLRGVLYGTRAGIAMRAVVDNRELAGLTGARPAWMGTLAWALGAGCAALAGILIAPILNDLSVIPLTFLVVYAYGAAVVGRLRNLPLTFAGAMLLGLGYSYLVGYAPQNGFFDSTPIQGLRQSLPVVVLFVALLVMRPGTIEGGRLGARRSVIDVPSLRTSVAAGAGLVVVVALAIQFLSVSNVINVGVALVTGIIVLSLTPLTGWAGQVSLCQMTFAGLGAFAMARVGGGSLLGLLAAMGLGGVVGALVALPALRLRGLYMALFTMAFALAMDNMFFPSSVAFSYGGELHVNRPSILGLHLSGTNTFVVFVAAVFALLAIVLMALRRGPFGRLLLAMKDSEAACVTLGMRLTVVKLSVFALSAAIAGLGGALLGAMTTEAGATDFLSQQSLPILLIAVIGGVATASGALVGGFSYGIVNSAVQAVFPGIPNIAYGLSGLAAFGVAQNPDGIVPLIVRTVKSRVRTALASPSGGGSGAGTDATAQAAGAPADVHAATMATLATPTTSAVGGS
ncbi:MAG: branched-chain amino acid ABC transporter permease [Acidimicrobiales bacterium]